MALRALRELSPGGYHRLMLTHGQEVLPYIYTPTVGQACQEYHTLGIKTRGLYVSLEDRRRILAKLRSWPQQHVRVIVVTDGERILGLGDLGANGMGISEGKIELYTAAAGVDPAVCLPVCLDVGTNNRALREHPEYGGLRRPRPTGQEYASFVDEFMAALKEWQPHVLIQFEDFGNHNAFTLLERYRGTHCCFNDDIQGTASITLAALLSALHVTGGRLSEQRILFLGAGEAATGIASLIAFCIAQREGIPEQEARTRCHLLDSKGLVCASRTDLQHHKRPFAHATPFCADLLSAVRQLKPTALIGVSAQGGAFTQEVVEAMAALNERPLIFPLSNPTHLAECTFEQAYSWTSGRVLFASGSPFDPIMDDSGRQRVAPQANNAYIFPAVGHAAVLTRASCIPEEVFLVAAEELAAMGTAEARALGSLFPPFSAIRDVSARIMAPVAAFLVSRGLGQPPSGWPPLKQQQGGTGGVGGCVANEGVWVQHARDAMWSVGGPARSRL